MHIIYFKNCVLSIHSVLQFAVFTYYIANFFMLFNILLWYFTVTYLLATLRNLWGYSFPDQGSNPGPRQWKHRALTIERPGNSLWFFFFNGWRRSYHIALLFNQSLFLNMLNYYLCFTIINSKQISRSRIFELKYLYMLGFRICTANCTQPTTSTFHYTFTCSPCIFL